MKLSGTVALYTQLKELENAVSVTKRQIALAEELLSEAPAKKQVRRKRKALTFDVPPELRLKPNGAEEHAN